MQIKSLIQALVKEELDKVLKEATDEEIGHLDDVLQVPKSALPFHNLFGDRYRILTSFNSTDPNSPFSRFEQFAKKTGWQLNPENMGELIKSVSSSYIANPDQGVQTRTKVEKMSIVKWVQELTAYLDGISKVMAQWNQLMSEMQKYSSENFKRSSRLPKEAKEDLKDKNI